MQAREEYFQISPFCCQQRRTPSEQAGKGRGDRWVTPWLNLGGTVADMGALGCFKPLFPPSCSIPSAKGSRTRGWDACLRAEPWAGAGGQGPQHGPAWSYGTAWGGARRDGGCPAPGDEPPTARRGREEGGRRGDGDLGVSLQTTSLIPKSKATRSGTGWRDGRAAAGFQRFI